MTSAGSRLLCVLMIALGVIHAGNPVGAAEETEEAHLAHDITAAAPATGGTLVLDSVEGFRPEGGTATIAPGSETQETVGYSGVSADTNELTGLTRDAPLDHASGTAVSAPSAENGAGAAPPVLADTYVENIEGTVCGALGAGATCQAVNVPVDDAWGTVADPVYGVTGSTSLPTLTFVNIFTTDDVIRSARGCNDRVCIHVTGEGRWVDHWESTAKQYHSDGCVRPSATFWRRPAHNPSQWNALGQFYASACQRVHPDAHAAVWIAEWPYGPLRSRDGAQLCNTWYPFDGAPCVLIKA